MPLCRRFVLLAGILLACSHFFVVSNMEQISESCARTLALRYEPQVRALEDNGARLLGECAVRRMMESMRAGCLDVLSNTVDNKAIAKQLVDAIISVETRQATLSLKHKAIPTLAGPSLSWHEQAIFKKPGIRTADDEYFHCPPETDVALYGYRMGTAEEAKALHFMKCKSRQHSHLDTSVGAHISFFAIQGPSGSISRLTFTCPQSPSGSMSNLLSSPSSRSLASPSSTSTIDFTTPIKSPAPPPPYKSPSPSSPMLQIPTEVPASSGEVEELRKTVADLQKRLEQMEAMMLVMSAKLFPK